MRELHVSTDPVDGSRRVIRISDKDSTRIGKKASGPYGRVEYSIRVYDKIAKEYVWIARAGCGLDCRCALKFVDENYDPENPVCRSCGDKIADTEGEAYRCLDMCPNCYEDAQDDGECCPECGR